MKIEVKNWKIVEKDGANVIAGSFNVKAGDKVVASQDFNDGYSSIKINLPATILAKAEELTSEIKDAINKHFIGDN